MANDNSQAAGDNEETLPRRRRMPWWVWVLVIFGTIMSMAAGTWFGWGQVGQARLDDLVAEIRSRGEPVDWKDMAEPPVPKERNAVLLYQKASEKLFAPTSTYPAERIDQLENMVSDLAHNRAYRREHAGDVAAVVELWEQVRPLIRQASVLSGADWGFDYSGPAYAAFLPLSPIVPLVRTTALAAVAAHEAGNDGDAIARLRDALAIARATTRCHNLIGGMVATVSYGTTIAGAEQVLPGLRIGPAPGASPEQARALILELLDVETIRQGFLRCLLGERCMDRDCFLRLRRGEITLQGNANGQIRPWPRRLLPAMNWDELWMMRSATSLVEGAKAGTWPESARRINDCPDNYWQHRNRLQHIGWFSLPYVVSVMLCPEIKGVYEQHFDRIARLPMAGTALAMRLYEVEKGKPVAALADLVAAGYLEKLPADPFSDKGEPIRYNGNPKQPLLYSVGRDGRDDGGTFKIGEDGGVDRESPDVVFFLHGDRPAGKVKWEPPRTSTTKEGR